MRVLATFVVALGLAVLPAMAAGGGDKEAAGNAAPVSPAAAATPAASPAEVRMESELQQLRDLIESQADQIHQQNEQLKQQQQQMQALEEQLHAASAPGANVAAGVVASPVSAAIGPTTGVTNATMSAAPAQEKPQPPTSINIKGISLTPVGFMAAETVWRQKALASDVNTPLNANIFPGNSAAHMSEFQASGRQSRIGMLVEGKLDTVKIGGYYEMDFLSAATTSNNNQSNSYSMRQRQFWAQAAFNSGWTITGGQMWSLLTETTKGMDNRSEALPQTIDAQYTAGFSWARQFGLRVTKNFNNKVWLGVAVEESQATLSVHGNLTAQAATTSLTCSPVGSNGCSATGTITINTNPLYNNFLLGAFGATGGLYNPLNNYAFNPAPDFVFKAAFEPGFGHYEVFGVLTDFRDRVFPCVANSGTLAGCSTGFLGVAANPSTSAFGAFNNSATGGGGGANARWNLVNKKVDVGIHFFGGTGIGRYGSVGLADLTTRPDGTLAPLHNYQSLGTLQFHPTPKLDINLNVGGEYEARAQYIASGKVPNEGYGVVNRKNTGCWSETLPLTASSSSIFNNTAVPTGVSGSNGFVPGLLGSCDGDTRNLIEGSLGFWYRFYKGPKGTAQFGMQYSNYVRNTWRGVGGASGTPSASGQPHSDQNMFFTSFRYVLP